jgi:hypothetical protein
MSKKISIQNIEVSVRTSKDDNDYFSLTDMAKWKNAEDPRFVVQKWMSAKFTIEFLGIWELLNNPENFNRTEFDAVKNQAGSNSFSMSPEKWKKTTNAIGIRSKSGRYGGGTFAHKDIALEFASWLSPEFKLYLIKEFQRLKELEKQTIYNLEWEVKRSIVKTNYRIHTDAIKKQLKTLQLSEFQNNLRYAEEADMLNLILFGQKAKDWEYNNLDLVKQGLNMRDTADITELIVLSGLETLNAYLINQGETKETRIQKLIIEAKKNLESIQNQRSVKVLSDLGQEKKK